MRRIKRSLAIVLGALILSALLPATSMAQGRWFIRSHRSNIVVYNYRPRPYVYRSSPYYYTYGPETRNYTSSYGYYPSSYGYYPSNYGYYPSNYGYYPSNNGYYPSNYGYWQRPHRNHFRFGVFVR